MKTSTSRGYDTIVALLLGVAALWLCVVACAPSDRAGENQLPPAPAGGTASDGGPESASGAQGTGAVSGKVQHPSGNPASGAKVTLKGLANASAETDANGLFALQGLPEGKHMLLVLLADGTQGGSVVFSLGPGQQANLGVITLADTGEVRGTVLAQGATDQTGTLVYLPGTSFDARTEASGAFSMFYVPQGCFDLRIERSGYVPRQLGGVCVSAGKVVDVGTTSIQKEGSCVPSCPGKQCGDDGCLGSCGTCAGGKTCSAAGQCVASCAPSCAGKQCGDDGCLGLCGTCAMGTTCNAAGQCAAGKDAGADSADATVMPDGAVVDPNCLANPWKVRIGAIRWDAWYGSPSYPGSPSEWVTIALSPGQYWYRVPFFGKVQNNTLQPIDGNSPAVMAKEIAHARRAGIDYWAFLEYPDGLGVGLDRALNLYLSSPDSSRVNFALIMDGFSYARAIDQNGSVAFLDHEAALLVDPRYETVLGGRPLVYVYEDICMGENTTKYCSPWMFDELSSRVTKAKGVRPYYVYLTSQASKDPSYANYLHMDAISSYAVTASMLALASGTSYATFQDRIRVGYEDAMRQVALGANLDVVPFASAGYDPSPRFECPAGMCWKASYGGDQAVIGTGTSAQVAAHVKSVAEWTAYHGQPRDTAARATSPGATLLIYAWNEFDEGGWLCPTLGQDHVSPNTERVDALKSILRPLCSE
jgi:hypothetical protein